MTPHSSQTPRYGQTTPSQQGQFLRPGAPVSQTRPPNYRASPYTSSASPRAMPTGSSRDQRRVAVSQDEEDWDKASSAWGDARKGSTPRADMGRTTPRG
jgi:hypothetical protein